MPHLRAVVVWNSREAMMAYIVFQYDRPTDTQHWNDYNKHVQGWIAQLLRTPAAVSFMAYRTVDGASPNTITMLEFHTMGDAQTAVTSEPMKNVLQELRSVGVTATVLLVEHSPFTPEPIRG
jgi:hypothetical protein